MSGDGFGHDTIYALSSGSGPAGVAVVRVSGPAVRDVLAAALGSVPPARRARLAAIRDEAGAVIDRGLVLYLPGPGSFTGEDVAEFQVHGGRAVVAALLGWLGRRPGLRAAEAGDFTRRAFLNGRLDLTAVEGLADLVTAETEAQRRQALRAAEGGLARRAEAWRADLVAARAAVEAELDFAEEEDVPGSIAGEAVAIAGRVRAEIAAALADAHRGERVREGLVVAILGPPNAGKSSLLNALARRDVAIVTDLPGTTRDVLEVHLDLGGQAVTLLDTAGLRETADRIEAEGIRRALVRAGTADLLIWLDERGEPAPPSLEGGAHVVTIRSKADRADDRVHPSLTMSSHGAGFPPAVSVASGAGIDALVAALAALADSRNGGEPALVTHARQRDRLCDAMEALDAALAGGPPEVTADALRRAGDAIGRLTGRIDVEDVLGAIFSRFCIGK